MSGLWVDALIVLLFILLGAVFVAAEIALISLRESQVKRLADQGRRGRVLASLQEDPNRFLAAVQVGVTVAGFLSAGFGASQITPDIVPWLVERGLSPGLADVTAFIVVTGVIVYLSLVLGELAPKRLALQRAESVSLLVAVPTEFLARITRPFIWLLSRSTNVVVRALGGDPDASREEMTEEELRGILAAHADLDAEERRVIDEVFEAGDRELREVMVPRTEVSFLDAGLTVAEAVARVSSEPHSRYPTVRGSADEIIGFVHIRDLLLSDEPETTLGRLVRPVLRFPGTKTVLRAMAEMRRDGHHLAIVVDEYGGTAGIVTLEDLVEELLGEIRDEYDVVEIAEADNGVLAEVEVDGLLNTKDFLDLTGVELPEGPYETVAGFVVAQLGRLPRVGDTVDVDGAIVEVAALDGRRAARLRISTSSAGLPE